MIDFTSGYPIRQNGKDSAGDLFSIDAGVAGKILGNVNAEPPRKAW